MYSDLRFLQSRYVSPHGVIDKSIINSFVEWKLNVHRDIHTDAVINYQSQCMNISRIFCC